MVVRTRLFPLRWAGLLIWASMVMVRAATGAVPTDAPTQAAGPTLARLSFWVPPERRDEFAGEYQTRLLPVLRRQGLVPSAEPGRATVDSVFSRLFVCASPVSFWEQEKGVRHDATLRRELRRLAAKWAPDRPDSLLRYSFRLYRYPLVPHSVVPAGPGQGHWRTFGANDSLANSSLGALWQDRVGGLWLDSDWGIFQYDGRTSRRRYAHLSSGGFPVSLLGRDGRMWIASDEGPVLRCDGERLEPVPGMPPGRIWAMLQDRRDGSLWLGTEKAGVWRYADSAAVPLAGGPAGAITVIFQDRDGNLWFGSGSAAVRYDGAGFTTLDTGLADTLTCMAQGPDGDLWFGSYGGASRYDGRGCTTYSTRNGLPGNLVTRILPDAEGGLWFTFWGSGVSRYDGRAFAHYTTRDGLAGNTVAGILQDRDGALWFGTNAGASRYDAHTLTTFTTRDGLPSDDVVSLLDDHQGGLWITFRNGGLCRYDGRTFAAYTPEEALFASHALLDRRGRLWLRPAISQIGSMARVDGRTVTVYGAEDGLPTGVGPLLEGASGDLWFSADRSHLIRFDGRAFTTQPIPTAHSSTWVVSMAEDSRGGVWLATDGAGALGYDRGTWTSWGRREGLPTDRVWGIVEDRSQRLWLGTYGEGLWRYDGQGFRSFGKADGLPVDFIMHGALVDRSGAVWFGTDGGGAVRFDGQIFQTLDRNDGLASDVVRSVIQRADSSIWFGCSGGITRYRPRPAPPPRVWVDAVVADRRYAGATDVRVSSVTELVTFELSSASFKTRPGGMVYRYRLRGYDQDWRTTREGRAEYPLLPRGAYTFEVQAVDRDLAYSDLARVGLTIHPPYGSWGLGLGLGLALIGLALAAGYGVRHRRERDQARDRLMTELETELQTAHELQMGLMPKAAPIVPGLSIAGRCLTANHVGGDFYHYFRLPGDRLAICITDVTGHAMDAAIPAVMFDGILDSQIRLGGDPQALFTRLNGILCEKLTGRTHVSFVMAEIDLSSRVARLANAGCPYPCHYRQATGEIAEVAIEAYPFGVRADTSYRQAEVQLEAGDYLVFYSDGLAEAANAAGDLFTFERTTEAIRAACAQGLPAAAVIDHLLSAVRTFTGDVAQGDDMTCVVVKVEE